MVFQKPKGMPDWLPEDKAVQSQVFDTLRKTAVSFGFQEVESPVMESTDLLTAKSGEEIKEQLFILEKKSTEELGLRFDLTIPLARMFSNQQKRLPKPVKWFGLSRMWRYEAPQKGRLREFYQLSIELFGSASAQADAECINLLNSCLANLQLTENEYIIKINNRKLLEGLLQQYVPDDKIEQIIPIIDKAAKIDEKEFTDLLFKAGVEHENLEKVQELIKYKGESKEVIAKLKTIALNDLAKQGLEELEAVIALVPKKLIVDLSLARGLAYYSGTVFECFDKDEKLRSIAGGGRYDQLIELVGGEPTPATGFAIGYATLSLLLDMNDKLPTAKNEIDYFIVAVTDDVREQAQAIALELRKKATVDLDVMGRKVGKQLDYANSIGARNVIIVGPDELAQKKVKLKNMKTGKEELIAISDL